MLRHLIPLFALYFATPALGAAVVYDNSAGSNNITGITYSMTVGSGSNRALAVFVHISAITCGTTQPTISSVTYGGVSLVQTLARASTGCSGSRIELWSLPAGTQPASGTNTIAVTLSSALGGFATIESGAISASGVDQTTTFTSSAANDGNSTTASVTIGANGANDLVIDSVSSPAGVTSTSQMQRWNDTNGATPNGGATAAGGTTSLSWTVSSGKWMMLGAAFKAAAASTATYDAESDVHSATTSSAIRTYSYTVGTGGNRQMAVFTHIGSACGNSEPVVSSVTYNGVALTRLTTKTNPGCADMSSDLWTMPANTQPATGANNLVIILSKHLYQGSFHFGVVTASNVDLTSAPTNFNSSIGNGTSATLTLGASGSNDLVIESICTGSGITSTSETQRWSINSSNVVSCDNSGGATAVGGTTSLSWTVTSDFWTMVGVSFSAAAPIKHRVVTN